MYYWRDSRILSKIKSGLINAEGEGSGNGDGSGGGETWYKDMPEDMQAWEEVNKAEKPEDFYKYVTNMRSHLGQSIRIPGEDAGKEDWAAFHEKMQTKVPNLMAKPDLSNEESRNKLYGSLGRPEKAESYVIPETENVDKAASERFKDIAHKIGLNQDQYNQVVEEFTAANGTLMMERDVAHKEAHAELKKDWGVDYNRRMSLATNIAKLTDAPPELVKVLEAGDADVASYKWLHDIATKFKGEGKNLLKDMNQNKGGSTPEEAAQKITEIRNNKEHPYWNKGMPGHKAALKQMEELYKQKNPA